MSVCDVCDAIAAVLHEELTNCLLAHTSACTVDVSDNHIDIFLFGHTLLGSIEVDGDLITLMLAGDEPIQHVFLLSNPEMSVEGVGRFICARLCDHCLSICMRHADKDRKIGQDTNHALAPDL